MRKSQAYYKYARNVITPGQIDFFNLKKEQRKTERDVKTETVIRVSEKDRNIQVWCHKKVVLYQERHIKEQINLNMETQLK